MSIETVHVREHSPDQEQASSPDRTVVDVSGVRPARVRQYARESAAAGHPEVYLERKGGRTFLVAE